MAENTWNLVITPPMKGFAPGYYSDTYTAYGDKNQAGDMVDADITNPSKLTQGLGVAALTNGTQTGAVTTLIKQILSIPTTTDVTWGIGGSKLYKITPTTITSDATYPHLIDKGAVTSEDGESVIAKGDYLYYFYNHSGSQGDFGRLTMSTNTFDDDYGSTVPTGAGVLTNNSHPSCLGDDGVIYFGNGQYVGRYDVDSSNTLSVDELDFYSGTKVVDVRYYNSRIWIAANFPNTTGSNRSQGVVYVWDGVSNSWDDSPNPKIDGKIGAIYVKNGVVYVWYEDLSHIGGYKLGYVNGNRIQELRAYSGSLPNFGQVGEYKGQIAWLNGAKLYLFGNIDASIPASLSTITTATYATGGAFANPFGTPLMASYATTNFNIVKLSGYSVSTTWKTIMFDVSTSIIDSIVVHYDTISSGARCDLTLRYNRGASTLSVGNISYTNDSAQIKKFFYPKQELDDFRLEFSWASGSASNPLAIRKIEIIGHKVSKN